ncbi:hypothetical protein BJX70DRAFT_409030 [Aspergillus crustosus]
MPQPKPRRKACDLCYRKRIKCDAQRPRCSHCVTYNSSCTFQAASRKSRAKKQEPSESVEGLQSRMKQLEENLHQALQKIDQLESCVPEETAISGQSFTAMAGMKEQEKRAQFVDFGNGSLDLPPLHETLPAVEKYLATLNLGIPLFHPGRLLQSLHGWYTPRGRRDSSTWAAINVVLALAYSCQVPSDQVPPSRSTGYYLDRAQSVLTEVIMGEADIVNVQTVLGLAMLFQGTRDWKPAAMLIAIALRLAHELGLHARTSSESFSPQAILERDRVFWIAYILDRDISLRTGQPPIQLETDIDIDFPLVQPADGAGLVPAADGSSTFNFFRARVQLAIIQGRAYESMYSARAQALNVHQRNETLVGIRHRLDDWASRIPSHFRPSAVLRNCNPDLLRSFGILYSSHLACRALICRAHAMETPWLQSLQDFGGKSLQRRMVDPILLPQGWQVLVHESREYMRLFMGVEPKDPAFIWMTGCAYVTGSVCLIANNMLQPNHEVFEHDQYLAELSVLLLDQMIEQDPYEGLERMRSACKELLQLSYNISLQNDFLHP